MLESTGVTQTRVLYNANGEKKQEGRWENVKLDANGRMMESTGATKIEITYNENGKKIQKSVGKMLT